MMMTLNHYLCIKRPQVIGYVKHLGKKKTMSFKVVDNKLLKIYVLK